MVLTAVEICHSWCFPWPLWSVLFAMVFKGASQLRNWLHCDMQIPVCLSKQHLHLHPDCLWCVSGLLYCDLLPCGSVGAALSFLFALRAYQEEYLPYVLVFSPSISCPELYNIQQMSAFPPISETLIGFTRRHAFYTGDSSMPKPSWNGCCAWPVVVFLLICYPSLW